MADRRVGPFYEGQGQGAQRPPGSGGRNRYDYEEGDPLAQPNGNGNGRGRNRYDGEPGDYPGRSSGNIVALGPTKAPPNGQPVLPPHGGFTSETMALGAETSRPPALVPASRDERLGIPSGPGTGRADRRRAARRAQRRRKMSITKEIPILIGVALFIALILKTFLVQAFVIPSGSMEQTIRVGDRVMVDKLTPWFGSKPERGDVVVFRDPGGWLPPSEQRREDPAGIKQGKEFMTFIGLLPSDNEQDLIKRVVGVGGDKVKCCDDKGRVSVNGKEIDEPYLYPGNRPSARKFDVTVPVGRVFVLGDHRSNSADSRYHLQESNGSVPEDLVVGRAVLVAWPFDHWGKLEDAGAYSTVPDPDGSASAASGAGDNLLTEFPIPAELPLVMGVVGLSRLSGRRQWIVRSDCGGLGGRRSFRFRRGRGQGGRWFGGQEP
jgi:signal peptidase I